MKRRGLLVIVSLMLTVLMAFTFPACSFLSEFLFGSKCEHEYTEEIIEPTCTEKGYTLHSCKHCDYTFADTYVDEAAHTPVEVAAVDSTYISVGYTEGVRCEVCNAVISGCEPVPIKGYDEFVPRQGNSAYGYYDFLNGDKAKEKQKFYIQMYSACEALLASTDDLKPDEAQLVDGRKITYYAVKEVDVTDYNLTNDELTDVWKVFYIENPVYYWLANNMMLMTRTSSKYEVSKIFVLMADETYVKYEDRAEYDKSIKEMTADCAALISAEMTQTRKAVAIHDFIINRIQYAYKSDGVTPNDEIWAHNITGAATYKKGVCETYAKTYMYLCLLNDVNCILVTGTGNSEEHAWNYIEIDGKWYGVDVTWDDGLRPVKKYLGANKTTMNSDHNTASCYYIQLPELSATALNLSK